MIVLVNDDWFYVSHRAAIGRTLRDAGFDVVIAAAESNARDEIEREGLRFVPMPFQPGSRSPRTELEALAAIRALYAKEKPDAVHHVTIKPVLYGSIVARALGVPAVINAVSGLGYVFIERATPSVRHRALRAGVQLAYRAALSGPHTRTIFQNPDDLEMFAQLGLVRKERTVLITGSGVDLTRFTASSLPEGPPVIVFPARMLWDKGVGELVEAARRVRKVRPDARFQLVGGAASQNPAVVPPEQLAAWQAEGVVEWLGHRTDMPEVFRRAHLVVLPSYREGLPLALAEAAACGRACVTTDVPGCRHVVEAGETGWLVPPRDASALAAAIEEALDDPSELARRGQRARALAEAKFSVQSVAARTLDVYHDLLRA